MLALANPSSRGHRTQDLPGQGGGLDGTASSMA